MNSLFLFILAAAIHEAGHIVSARLLGIRLLYYRINPAGIVLHFDYQHVPYYKEMLVHLGGPLLGLASAATASCLTGDGARFFIGVSATMSLVNLLPVEGFDGGGALAAMLGELFLPDTVYRTSKAVSAVFVLLLWCAVLWIELRVGGNLGLMVFAVYVMITNIK